ncbi:AAA family ATPase, partial [Bacillus paranthracis]|uniref:AAA family ATPase n=1 Tax=Bacillus paranthracis TaxID=2026186 RepID=UPI002FD7CB4F
MSRIILKKLIVQGVSYRRTIKFNEDLTIISGEKTSGKSLILSLIDYCFGKSNKIDLNVQPELDAKCDQVFLEINIDKEVLTLNRMLKEKQSKISIYFCAYKNIDEYTPKTLDLQDAMEILMHKLNINEYKLIRHKKHSNKKEIEMVSFRDIFRYVYIHQHELGTGDFLEKKSTFKANKNPHAFKMMFNLIEVDKGTLKEQLVKVQNDIDETRRELFGLNSYLKDLDALNKIELQLKADKLQSDIKHQKKIKIEALEKSKTNSNNNEE